MRYALLSSRLRFFFVSTDSSSSSGRTIHNIASNSLNFSGRGARPILPSNSLNFSGRGARPILPSNSSNFSGRGARPILPSNSSIFSGRGARPILPSNSSNFSGRGARPIENLKSIQELMLASFLDRFQIFCCALLIA